jgi:hypothetical protein
VKRLDCTRIRALSVGFVAAIVLGGSGSASADFTFGEPVNLGPPINTPYGDYNVYFSADSLELYVSSDRPGGLGYFDMWRSTRENADNPWGPLANVQEINSSYNEVFPCLSADGLILYFSDWWEWNAAGNRPGGVGHHDLWMRTRPTTNDPWGPPANMGAIINSSTGDVSPSVSQDGKILIFASKRSGSLGGNYDLWMSTRPTADSDWAAPVNMGPAVNSSAHDCEACISNDGLAVFFTSDRPGGMGSFDMWMTTRRSQAAAWSPPVNLGPAINTAHTEGAPSLSPDQKTLYFVSDQPGGIGGWDMYELPIIPILDFNGDGIVGIGDLLFLIQSWGQDDSTTDIGPAPWGDGIVDEEDLELLMSYWGQEIDDPTLIAHWALDETQGNIAQDSANEHHGTLHGEPLWQPTGGKVNGALQLDGINDYVSTPFVLDPHSSPFSVFAWVKGGSPDQVIISQTGGADWLLIDMDGLLMTGLKAAGTSGRTLVAQAFITDANWHRIGFVWNGMNRILYVDDVEVARDTQGNLAGSSNGLYIGAGKGLESGGFWSGLIDDVRIYNRAVTP